MVTGFSVSVFAAECVTAKKFMIKTTQIVFTIVAYNFNYSFHYAGIADVTVFSASIASNHAQLSSVHGSPGETGIGFL
jgi:hypothetical protein